MNILSEVKTWLGNNYLALIFIASNLAIIVTNHQKDELIWALQLSSRLVL